MHPRLTHLKMSISFPLGRIPYHNQHRIETRSIAFVLLFGVSICPPLLS